MVYSDVFLFDLSDSVEDGKSGERSARYLVAVKCLFLSGIVWLFEDPCIKINEAMCVFCSGSTVMNTAPFSFRA